MADYARSEVTISYGATSALQDPDFEKTLTSTPTSPTKFKQSKLSIATGAATTVPTSEFTVVQEVYVQNLDTTNYIIVSGTDVDLANTYSFRLLAGEWIKLVRCSLSGVLVQANTAACVVEVIIIGT